MDSTRETPPRHMSLIPYPYESGEVVLRRGSSVVVYDAQSRQLSVRNTGEQALDVTQCPYCRRPLREEFVSPGHASHEDDAVVGDSTSATQHRDDGSSFIDPNYFRKLAASRRPTPVGSAGPSTPSRAFTQPALRSGRSRDVSGVQDPPSGAEFVASEPRAPENQGISNNAFSQGFFKQFFREVRELGRGGNGIVLLVEHLLDGFSVGMFACKRIPVGNNHVWLQKVLVEVRLLQKIPHQNLVSYHWVWIEDHQSSQFGPSVPHLWILQEFCNGGDLHNYVLGPRNREHPTAELLKERIRRRSKGEAEPPIDLHGPSKLTFDEIFSFFRDITSGLHHLHSKGYIHRDLKPSNCLLQYDGATTKILISDFGEVQAAGVERGSTGATGTISYCAPEVLLRDASDGSFGNFTTKSDIFSLGMIVYFMCFGRLPYSNADDINEDNEDLEELRAEIIQWGGFNDGIRARSDLPERLYRYLKRLLSVDPNERPSTEEILASIKGGVGLGDNWIPEEIGRPRVSSLDSPRIRPMASGKQSRPGLSISSRQNSAHASGQASPLRRRHSSRGDRDPSSHDRPKSPIDNSVAIRPRKLDLSSSSSSTSPSSSASSSLPGSHPPQSPRLMLPPPPERNRLRRLFRFVNHDTVLVLIRLTIFAIKTVSLVVPCTPYVANAWALYPLLGLAVLDAGLLSFDLRRSLLLLSVHIVALMLAQQHGRLCEGQFWFRDRPVHYRDEG